MALARLQERIELLENQIKENEIIELHNAQQKLNNDKCKAKQICLGLCVDSYVLNSVHFRYLVFSRYCIYPLRFYKEKNVFEFLSKSEKHLYILKPSESVYCVNQNEISFLTNFSNFPKTLVEDRFILWNFRLKSTFGWKQSLQNYQFT